MTKFILSLAIVLLIAQLSTQSQSGVAGTVAGRWRAVLVNPNGGTQDVSLNLEVKDGTVTGVVFGLPVTGKVEGETVTLSLAIPGRPGPDAVLTGQMTGDEILFRVVGLSRFPSSSSPGATRVSRPRVAYPTRQRSSASSSSSMCPASASPSSRTSRSRGRKATASPMSRPARR